MPREQRDIINSINLDAIGGANPNSEPEDNQKNKSLMSETWAYVWETIRIIIVSLAIIIPIRYYLVQPFFVKGASMEDNFHDGDYLLIDEISYRFNEPSRGDVIVFRYPENPSQYFIKRIIGLPGETVEVKNNRVTIYNSEFTGGFVLDESYLSSDQITVGDFSEVLDDDEYFVLGDNRRQSSDSRRWGPLEKGFITGKAFLRLWPFTRITKVSAIEY